MSNDDSVSSLRLTPQRFVDAISLRYFIYFLAWFPVWFILTIAIPNSVPALEKLRQQDALPASGQFLLRIVPANTTASIAPTILILFLFAIADLAVSRAALSTKRLSIHFLWILGVGVLGFAIAAFAGYLMSVLVQRASVLT